MPLPSLNDWDTTRDSLHRAAQVVSAIRKAFIKPQPNALQLSLFVTPTGVSTGVLPGGNEFSVDFVDATLNYRESSGQVLRISLEKHHQQGALVALVSSMKTVQFQTTQLVVKGGFTDKPFEIDRKLAADYATALFAVYSSIARFRARLLGTMTPAVIWAHGFDLSTLWFPGNNLDEQSQPHCNYGFSPGSAGFPRPYLYAYVWPRPDDLTQARLPEPARWNSEGWTGAIVDYDVIARENQPEVVIESLLEQIHRILSSKMQP